MTAARRHSPAHPIRRGGAGELDRPLAGAPSDRWLGDEDDYLRWIREPAPALPHRSAAAAAARGYHQLVFPESSLSERPLRKAASLSSAGPTDQPAIWSRNHRAWLFHDRRTDLWYRHDTGTERWLPIDLCGD